MCWKVRQGLVTEINTVDSCDCWYCVLFCFPASIYQENRFNGIDSESSTVYWEIKKGNRNICGQFRLILFICLVLLEPPRSPLCHLAFHLTTDLLRFERTGQIPEIGRLVQTHSLCISATHRRDEKSPSWHSQRLSLWNQLNYLSSAHISLGASQILSSFQPTLNYIESMSFLLTKLGRRRCRTSECLLIFILYCVWDHKSFIKIPRS